MSNSGGNYLYAALVSLGVLTMLVYTSLAERLQHKLVSKSKPAQESKLGADGSTADTETTRPRAMSFTTDHVQVNEQFETAIAVDAYPPAAVRGWFEQYATYNGQLDVTQHIFPADRDFVASQLTRQITRLIVHLNTLEKSGKLNREAWTNMLEGAEALKNALLRRETNVFDIGIYFKLRARSLKELQGLDTTLRKDLKAQMLKYSTPKLRMDTAFRATMPLGRDTLLNTQQMHTEAVGTMFPFVQNVISMETGVLFGFTPALQPIFFDMFKEMRSYHMVILGVTGSGKSFCVKKLLYGFLLYYRKLQMIIIDPSKNPETGLSEFTPLTRMLGGQVVTLGKREAGAPTINPMDIRTTANSADPLKDKIERVVAFFGSLYSLSQDEKSLLDTTLLEVYKSKKIDPISAQSYTGASPLLSDLQAAFKKLAKNTKKTTEDRAIAARFVRNLEPWVTGTLNIFNQQTNINLDGKFFTFDISEVSREMLPAIMFLIMDFTDTVVKTGLDQKLIICDEAHHLLGNEFIRTQFAKMFREYRKYNAGACLLSQSAEDFLCTKEGRVILDNSLINILMKHDRVNDEIVKYFDLNEAEVQVVKSAETGRLGYSEALLISGHSKTRILIYAFPDEYPLFTTKPGDLKRLAQNAGGADETY